VSCSLLTLSGSLPASRYSFIPIRHSLTSFFATHPKNSPITPFLATLPKSHAFKSFACHTSETPRGHRHKLLTRFPSRKSVPRSIATRDLFSNPTKDFHPERLSGVEGRLLNSTEKFVPRFFVLIRMRTLLQFFALFCTQEKLNPFLFMRFRTLWQKCGVWWRDGISHSVHLRPFPYFVTSLPRCC
jgi:hypothetical protein